MKTQFNKNLLLMLLSFSVFTSHSKTISLDTMDCYLRDSDGRDYTLNIYAIEAEEYHTARATLSIVGGTGFGEEHIYADSYTFGDETWGASSEKFSLYIEPNGSAKGIYYEPENDGLPLTISGICRANGASCEDLLK